MVGLEALQRKAKGWGLSSSTAALLSIPWHGSTSREPRLAEGDRVPADRDPFATLPQCVEEVCETEEEAHSRQITFLIPTPRRSSSCHGRCLYSVFALSTLR